MDENNRAKAMRAAVLERELADAIRRLSFEDLEKIPEMRDLMQHIVTENTERARIADTLDTLPHADVQKLFSDYIEEKFDVHLHTFFSRLYDGIIGTFRKTMSARMEVMEEAMADLKRSVLMASLHPHAWVEGEIVKACIDFLMMQPGMKSGLHPLYRYVAYDARLPIPGAALVDKYHYLLRVLRSAERFREIGGFLFELVDFSVVEEREAMASADGYREASIITAMAAELEDRRSQEP